MTHTQTLPIPTIEDQITHSVLIDRSKPSAHVRIETRAFPMFTATTIDGPGFSISVFERYNGEVHTTTYLHGADEDTTEHRTIGDVTHITHLIGPKS